MTSYYVKWIMKCMNCRRMKIEKLNEVERVNVLGSDHEIVSLDAKEEDYIQARGVFNEIKKLQDFLYSDTAKNMDSKIKDMLSSYLDSKMRTMTQKNFMDALNLDTDVVAKDIHLKVKEDQRRTGVEHIIQTMLTIKRNGGALGPSVDQPTLSNLAKMLGINQVGEVNDGYTSDEEEEENTTVVQPTAVVNQPRQQATPAIFA